MANPKGQMACLLLSSKRCFLFLRSWFKCLQVVNGHCRGHSRIYNLFKFIMMSAFLKDTQELDLVTMMQVLLLFVSSIMNVCFLWSKTYNKLHIECNDYNSWLGMRQWISMHQPCIARVTHLISTNWQHNNTHQSTSFSLLRAHKQVSLIQLTKVVVNIWVFLTQISTKMPNKYQFQEPGIFTQSCNPRSDMPGVQMFA